ncbi:uncharacterized protein LOC122869801 isoform X2 [Siniperca chuatsi]|uniref:uncharacterized protein LOC122869801 isoform X2 n=1 Tax=Siniperca chuatsi TaxID=119488 RepID=UPI001CE228B1|nr:uncharacterized protein LOC122869801 isoform X2 [Siniperca chuatsi]
MLEDMMGFTRKFLSFLTYNAIIMVCQCTAGHPPPPTGLTYKWLDAFTVNVSWKKPVGLLDGSEVGYKYFLMKNGTKESLTCTQWRNFTETCLTEETGPSGWTYTILTDGSPTCNSSNESEAVSINIISNATAKLVKDFKCFIYPNELNCSWIPVHQNLNLTLSYRVYGRSQELIEGLKVCDQPFSSGMRNGCTLKVAAECDICILVDSEAGMSTFRPVLVVPSPKLHIREDGDNLKLNWTPPEVGRDCVWIYEIRYKKCNEPQVLLNFTKKGEPTMQMAYDKRCLYEFQSKVMTGIYCKNIFSDFSEVVTYDTAPLFAPSYQILRQYSRK